ncbi:MAG: hypothetical protein GY950_29690, partial [bacterium]|nr:hypothetical protein [bacterium]
CDQDNWEPGKNIIDVESHIFGYKIIASRKRQQVFLVFGDYRERHYFPYIITAILSGHVGEKFGKLYLLEGDGESWGRPLKITKEGRFSCSSPQICLNDGMKHVHLVWEDARRGYNRKAIFYDSFRENGFGGNRKVSGGLTRADTFAPAIACDDVDNLYIAWSTFEGDNVGKLYFRQRIKNQWSESTALAEKSVLSSLTIDNSSNIHLVWENGYNVFYKINCKSSWTKTKKFEGQRAEMCVDKENNVHLLIVRYRNIEDYKFVHHVFKFRR